MRTIGLIGGMSWESSAVYYRDINRGVQKRLGGLHSAQIIMYSVDFAKIERLQHSGNWERLGVYMADAAYSLQKAGAEAIWLCTNTMHKVAPKILENIKIPFIHIADTTAKKLLADGISRVALLGTKFTMEQEFYRGRIERRFGIEVMVPKEQDQAELHRIIYEELCLGKTEERSREYFVQVISSLQQQGAQAVILGCTEIGMLISDSDSPIPVYDTTKIHIDSAVEWMLGG